ncbi:MAG: glycosyltransferase family 39 protein [Mailhella sp.]|nr:glycosyltransferase family 39 protein [Mailhella sp.]
MDENNNTTQEKKLAHLTENEGVAAGMSADAPSSISIKQNADGTDDQDNPDLSKDEAPESAHPSNPPIPAEAPAGPCSRLFNGLSYAGLPLLILFSVCVTFFNVWHVRDLWFSDEVRLADAFMNFKAGDWLVLSMNGLPYADKPPLYFWFMEALDWIPGVSTSMAMFLASAISHALFIASVWLLARFTGHDRRVAFASGLIALSCLFISGLAGYIRMDLLFAAVISLAMLCLYRGACKASAPLWLAAGFLLLAAATLIKGPFGIALAISVSILFLCWRGTPGRLGGRDGIPGFLLMLLIIAAWLGTLYMTGHAEYVHNMLGVQLAGRMLDGGRHAEPWWHYGMTAPLIWLPWTLLALFINWFEAARGLHQVWRERKEKGGDAWLWLWLFCGAAILSAVRAKLSIYLLPLAAPLAVLTARSLLRLSPARSKGFFCLCSVIFAMSGLTLVLADVYPQLKEFVPAEWLPAIPPVLTAWINAADGTIFMGSALIVLAALLLLFTRLSRPDGSLLLTSAGLAAAIIPYYYFIAPSLSPLLSPRSQAASMAEMSKTGYAVAAYRVYPGVYAWHFNELAGTADGKRASVPDLTDPDARTAWISAHPKTVLAMPLSEWNTWQERPVNSSVIISSWMADKQYVVAAVNAAPENPAPQEQDQNMSEGTDATAPGQDGGSSQDQMDSEPISDSAQQVLKELALPGQDNNSSYKSLQTAEQSDNPSPADSGISGKTLERADLPTQKSVWHDENSNQKGGAQ